METVSNSKKVINIVKTVLVWIVVAIAVFMMVFTLLSSAFLDKNDRSLFGLKFYIVLSDSMAATDFSAGDMVISKSVDITTLEEGDIITFVSQNSQNYGEVVTHKIRKVTADSTGSRAFVTYGTTTNTDDETLATVVLGKYIGKVPKLGTFFTFLKTPVGYILCILLPFMLLIISQCISCVRLARQYRKEKMEEINAERDQLEQELAEARKMREELDKLKAMLEAKAENNGSGDATNNN